MAPHISEELWHMTGNAGGPADSVHVTAWPAFVQELTVDDEIELVLQVNGKIVSKVVAPRGLSSAEAESLALNDAKVKSRLDGQPVRKVIVVANKLVNLVV
jgi:leucyl-tRNA synthetase